MQSLTRYLEGRLKLKINPVKSKVAKMSECGFLGFTIVRGKIRWLEKKLVAFKHRVKELTGRSWGCSGAFKRHVACPRNGTGLQASARPARKSMEFRLHKLGQYVRGWMGYFGISEYYRPIPELDEWIRRRIRMGYWKQWRWPRTRSSTCWPWA